MQSQRIKAAADGEAGRLELVDALLLPESNTRLSYHFLAGHSYLIQGHNGAGKSTLLQRLAGIEPVAQGIVRIGELPLASKNWRGKLKWNKAALMQIQYVPQHIEDMWFGGTIGQELKLTLQQYSAADGSLQKRLEQALERYGITPSMHERELQSLSVGQQKRLALAISFSLQAEWLLLDEPFAGLDQAGKQLVLESLAQRKQAGQGTIIVSHQLEELMPLIDENVLLDEGGLHAAEAGAISSDEARFALLLQQADEQLLQPWELHRTASAKQQHTDPHRRHERISRLPSLFDPRSLMLSMLLCSASLLLWNSWYALALYGVLALSTAVLLRRSSANWLGIVLGFAFISAIFAVVGGLSLAPLAFYAEPALQIAQRMLSLLVIIVLGLPLLSLMTPFRLQRALQQSFAPLRKLKLSLDSYALLVSLIFRIVPMLSKRWQQLQSLCRTRYKQTGLLSWQMLYALMLAYVRSMLKLSDQLATSLELRGYDRIKEKPLLHARVHWQRQDSLLLLFMLGLALINLAIHRSF